jgi:hypothetical protein
LVAHVACSDISWYCTISFQWAPFSKTEFIDATSASASASAGDTINLIKERVTVMSKRHYCHCLEIDRIKKALEKN